MSEEDRSLRSVYQEAEQNRSLLENSVDSNSTAFQEKLFKTIELFNRCLRLVDQLSLFSRNESLEDIATIDLQYLLLHYRIAELMLRINGQDRKSHLERAGESYESFLKQLDDYDILSKRDEKLLETYQESPADFSTASTSDAAQRRATKIDRFKEEKALRQQLEYMQKNPSAVENDELKARELHLTKITYCTHQTFQSLESIAQELHILSLAPPMPPPQNFAQPGPDLRQRNGRGSDPYSDRLDSSLHSLSAGLRGPLLDKHGKPLRPFTLTSKRQDFADGVFRPSHNLPTMSIDEYLEEERRRGGMIDGGGPQSEAKPRTDDDDMDAADRETMKAREWDDFVESNPKGSGNTLNRG